MSELAPAPEPLFPPLILAIYIACVSGAGALANCALLAALFKRTRNGLFLIIIQLVIADFIQLAALTAPELWSNNERTWIFGRSGCIAYRGLSILSSTASLYFIATIALHTISTANIEIKALEKKASRVNREDDEEIRDSRHSLVASSDSSTPRTMNVDYRFEDKRVPVAPPSIFVWVLSASLSVPEFALSTTIREDDAVVCTLADTSHKINMHSMIALFNLFLPVLILTSTGGIVVCKLYSKVSSKLEGNETSSALKLTLCLIIMYMFFCTPRSILYVYSLYVIPMSNKSYLDYDTNTMILNLIFSALYLAAISLRPILCISLLPRLRNVLTVGFRNIDEV
ncbi:unnamed protein product [Danaus chrysippus]|uniref:(African queen) hypothetical protein n=1 Tax=Danaus chrysippus TaxID=151541 RepID=A0A8J2R6J9_9NEOP|nr:unnamed protein product [Danaus chrysippus]